MGLLSGLCSSQKPVKRFQPQNYLLERRAGLVGVGLISVKQGMGLVMSKQDP